ncbi:aminotransferase class I/II-fold pyridoxal phosphate-dependent enzyme [Chitinibacter fontanus]|uniref:Aminotransferase class I/II-fold pyridoxal phosphate-dependent enzyme n=1 Tax=Chitinibacter fontanus TaxID=1737446 RepID=A0A7D5ZJP4_9NEIS|nr:aminotransferase class I/II-fold pyridoxal phosphate-dependent enzyme [Chitinibacter fontanus]QLI82989.1 aminotransferase class I/II-fold pyridoxal phosphate-dependent enzyme [Chitinibacter fontanus]
MQLATQFAHAGLQTDPQTGAISTPIYQTATFAHPAIGQSTGFDYSRSANPTRLALEQAIARAEGGSAAFAFASGLAALSTLFSLFSQGDHLIVSEGCYGGTYRLLDQIFARFGISVTYVPVYEAGAYAAAITPQTKAILIESVSNPCLQVPDFAALLALKQQHDLLLLVDNTFLTPYWFRPLEQGADVVIHSASKFIAGHNDTIAGLLAVREPELAARVGYLQNAIGATLGAQDAWLTMRGMKTLALRLAAQQANALAIAQFLQQQTGVRYVLFPGLPSDSQHQKIQQFSSGFGAVLSFAVTDTALVEQIISRLQLISYAESLGGVESLITVPEIQTHANLSVAERERLGVSDTLLRLSVGIEALDDLLADLAQALA